MKPIRILALVGVLATVAGVSAAVSGMLGIYGIVEKVIFEPNESAPERIQVWGAFAYVEGRVGGSQVSAAKRGYLYFRMPPMQAEVIKREWNDLKALAGTGQAIGFGSWAYIGGFGSLQPDVNSRNPPYILEHSAGNPITDLRVRPADQTPASPALYQTDTGIVKLTPTGSHADIVKLLQDALKR
jgi:hypothetical protein